MDGELHLRMHAAQDEEVAPLREHHRGAAAGGLVAEVAADAVRLDIGMVDNRRFFVGLQLGQRRRARDPCDDPLVSTIR